MENFQLEQTMYPIGILDKNGKEIRIGDKLYGKNFDGNMQTFTVRWSDYRNDYIGDSREEIYDIGSNIFNQYEITNR